MTIGPQPPCLELCKHYTGKKFNEAELRMDYFCNAFPEGIPEDIVLGIVYHTSSYKGDNGFQYEAQE